MNENDSMVESRVGSRHRMAAESGRALGCWSDAPRNATTQDSFAKALSNLSEAVDELERLRDEVVNEGRGINKKRRPIALRAWQAQ